MKRYLIIIIMFIIWLRSILIINSLHCIYHSNRKKTIISWWLMKVIRKNENVNSSSHFIFMPPPDILSVFIGNWVGLWGRLVNQGGLKHWKSEWWNIREHFPIHPQNMPFQTNKQFHIGKDSDFIYLVSVIDLRINFLMTVICWHQHP